MFLQLTICTWPAEGQLSSMARLMKGASQDTCFLFKPGLFLFLYPLQGPANDGLFFLTQGLHFSADLHLESEKCDSKNFWLWGKWGRHGPRVGDTLSQKFSQLARKFSAHKVLRKADEKNARKLEYFQKFQTECKGIFQFAEKEVGAGCLAIFPT